MVEISEKDDFCVYCYDFDGQGHAINAKENGTSNDSYLTWWHLDALNPQTRDFLGQTLKLDPVAIDALMAEDTRPRMEEFETGLMIILRGINTHDADHPEDMISLRIWIDQKRVITIRRRVLKSIRDLVDQIERGAAPLTGGDMLNYIADRLISRIPPVIQTLEDSCDTLEEEVIDDPDKALRGRIVDIRKKAIILRRYLAPQRDVMAQIRNLESNIFSRDNRRQFQEHTNHSLRMVEDLDMLRERTQIIQDELTTALADNLNRNMYLLSVIAAIFLPLGFLTGLMGINIGGMPGVDDPRAFWLFSGALLILILFQVIWFRKAKWF